MQEIKQELIICALELCGKTIEEMMEIIDTWEWFAEVFSYPHFFAYLLYPEFIEKFTPIASKERTEKQISWEIWEGIYFHQSWNPKPLEDLLSKIYGN